jgi:hypothetical protein
MYRLHPTRRTFLRAICGAAGGLVLVRSRSSAEQPATPDAPPRPAVTQPRATSGDSVEPAWSERLTITVGPADADIVGTSQRALQAAVDYVARLGGGTVRILPGTYTLRNAVRLASGVRLVGCGEETILCKAPSTTTRLAADSDWYDQEITLENPEGFELGDGIALQTRNPHHGGTDIVKRTLVARDGRRYKLDRPLRQNFWLAGDTTASTLFALLDGDSVCDVAIENLLLDGNRQHNALLDGNYAGCIFLQDCNRVSIRRVIARNYHGDGISWQICHDVLVEQCQSFGHAGLGLHPGSGSQRPVMRNNHLHHNDIGLFFCWGVKYGLASGNRIEANRVGISIGHRDTDNLICDNDVLSSSETGVLFRPERGRDFAPHRNRLERNRIVDSGGESGIAVDVQGETEDVGIVANVLRETRGPHSRVGIRLGAATQRILLADNTIEGFHTPVLRETAA